MFPFNPKKYNFSYLDSLCGQGKSHSIIQHIRFQNNDRKTLYVVDTNKQAIEFNLRCKDFHVGVDNTFYQNLLKSFGYNHNTVEYRKFVQKQEIINPTLYANIIAISYQNYLTMKHNEKSHYFEHIIFDDIRSVVGESHSEIPLNAHRIYPEYFKIERDSIFSKQGYYELILKNQIADIDINDDVLTPLRQVFKRSDTHYIIVKAQKYQDMIDGYYDKSAKKDNKVIFYTLPKEKLFHHNNVTFLRHDFLNSELGLILQVQGYQFKKSPAQQYLKTLHLNPNIKVEIEYFCETDRIISHYFMSRNDNENYLKFMKYANEKFKNSIGIFHSFLNSFHIKELAPNINRISTISQGLNAYSDYKNVVCCATMNHSNERTKLYNDYYNFEKEIVINFSRVQNDFQTIMRSGLRNYEKINTPTTFRFLVLDHFSSDYIVESLKDIVEPENISVKWSEDGIIRNLTGSKTGIRLKDESEKVIIDKEYKRKNAAKNRALKKELIVKTDDEIDEKLMKKREYEREKKRKQRAKQRENKLI